MEAEQLQITEAQIIQPLSEVLTDIAPKPLEKDDVPREPSKIAQSLDDLFPEQKIEEKNIQRAKDVLGDLASELTPAQLKDVIVETQYLVSTWLDDFEREIFKGKTLQELLHDKGGL